MCSSDLLAVDMDVRAAGLDSGNYWWSKTPDIQANYDIAAKPNLDESRELPSTFLTCTTLKDPSKRAHGHHTMEAFSFVSWEAFRRWENTRLEDRPEAYKKFKENLTARMFEALENTLPGIRDATVFAELGTPLTNHHYVASTSGNLYGTEKTRSHVGPFSWPIKTPINGLMMCGASTLGHRSEEHTSELQSQAYLVCRLLLEKKKNMILSFLHMKYITFYCTSLISSITHHTS